MSKSEIEKELQGKGDFVQIDHLGVFLKEDLPTDIRKFAMEKMAGIYEKKMMFGEAAKIYNNLSIISIPFKEKMKYHVKEAELCIKGGLLREADYATQKAISQANTFEKNDIMFSIKQFYKKQAEVFEKEIRRNNAARLYEKLLELSTTEAEKREVREKLMGLYEKLGKFREYNVLKGMNGN
jgi:hypothetical protein